MFSYAKVTIMAIVAAAMTTLGGCSGKEAVMSKAWPTLDGAPPIVIAHRGASGYRPEHTLEGYTLAIEMGADIIEPDLVFSKDGVLVVRHDRYLSTTTDVADHPEFADRRRKDVYDASVEGVERDDWWVEDFTLAELKTLRARQPFKGRSTEYDGLYEIPTFAQVLELAAAKAKEKGRPIGVYPETKHPAFFASIGHDFEAPLLAALKDFDAGPVYIQSFEPEILQRLKGKTSARLIQLVFEAAPGAGPNIPLDYIADYADGVGPSISLVLRPDGEISSLVKDAHALGLAVHPWTFRADALDQGAPAYMDKHGASSPVITESKGRPENLTDTGMIEIEALFGAGVDGLFSDFPDAVKFVRDQYSAAAESPGKAE